jgi:hypothetical protein
MLIASQRLKRALNVDGQHQRTACRGVGSGWHCHLPTRYSSTFLPPFGNGALQSGGVKSESAMSSLAASRADNFYFPPEFDPQQGSLNAQRGTHALGKRAKHIDKGIITVRCATLISRSYPHTERTPTVRGPSLCVLMVRLDGVLSSTASRRRSPSGAPAAASKFPKVCPSVRRSPRGSPCSPRENPADGWPRRGRELRQPRGCIGVYCEWNRVRLRDAAFHSKLSVVQRDARTLFSSICCVRCDGQ